MADILPPEPDTGCPEPVTLIRFRCPDGKTFSRRFLASDQLRVLLTYLGSNGYKLNNYKVLTTYPRRDVSIPVHCTHFRPVFATYQTFAPTHGLSSFLSR